MTQPTPSPTWAEVRERLDNRVALFEAASVVFPHFKTHVRVADLAFAIARVKALEEALEPFGAFGLFLSGADEEVAYQFHDLKATVGDFRRARQALGDPT